MLSAARMAKRAVNRGFESSLAEGSLYEGRRLHSLVATHDQTEDLAALSEKAHAELHPSIIFTDERNGFGA